MRHLRKPCKFRKKHEAEEIKKEITVQEEYFEVLKARGKINCL